MPTMEEEYEEEIVLVELMGVPNPDVILQSKGSCSILGLNTDKPVLQLENYVFQGKYEDILGTCLVFKQDENGKTLTYECQTTRKLSMSRVVLKKKAGMKETTAATTTSPEAPQRQETADI